MKNNSEDKMLKKLIKVWTNTDIEAKDFVPIEREIVLCKNFIKENPNVDTLIHAVNELNEIIKHFSNN